MKRLMQIVMLMLMFVAFSNVQTFSQSPDFDVGYSMTTTVDFSITTFELPVIDAQMSFIAVGPLEVDVLKLPGFIEDVYFVNVFNNDFMNKPVDNAYSYPVNQFKTNSVNNIESLTRLDIGENLWF